VACNKLFAALQVAVSNFMDAESLVSRGMLKRSTAATNANSESRHVFYLDSLTSLILPPIENNCRQFCTNLVQNLY
jgi:hypothetical protein